jgi:hypothetical protein
MVAAAPAVIRKRKPGERGPEIPALLKMKARSLYLNACQPIRVIAEKCGLPEHTVRRMASYDGWVKLKDQRKEALIANQDTRADELSAQVMTAIADESLEICGEALKVTRSGLEQGDLEGAKKAQAASSTLKNLVTSAKVLRDPGSSAIEQGPGITNFFFVGSGVTQGASEPKPVTEIEAKPAI